eukprot:CAMPEP_0203841386 /NCGR_PEP_ID=MMETSP0359-20131031/1354_1 /ASSEMBLY_ACC=CAM_ASM_000338 /TAXON_ID=268821 /ORGANISM="Scrippsiella Hangoei, Strain SHTV-5" /LENGTH=350 /DNA_ID=CAMNT_0050755787 /DNA_START=39 /DNA_END=1091 /DNA_ORIENTATION=+
MAERPTLERVFVTGGQGFLGAYVLRNLLREGAAVALLDVKVDLGILHQILSAEEIGRVKCFYADIADASAVKDAIFNFRPTAVIHLAGVQIPTVRANPALGVSVNLAGTVNVFEAVRLLAAETKTQPVPVVYASSAAVLGPSSDYADGASLPAERDNHKPRTMYGVFKLCNEGMGRIYWQDYSVPSVALRPLTIFGVGREIGLTSGPTKAVKAAVLGRPFVVEVTGVTGFHYVDDVARLFIDSAVGVVQQPGAHVCGVRGHVASYEEFLAEASRSVPEVAKFASIKPGAPEVPIHGDVDESPLQVLVGRPQLHRSLADAIADMASLFKDLHSRGQLHDRDLGPPPTTSKL